MKLLPVVTASAVASLIAAASIVPAYGHDAEPVIYLRITSEVEIEPVEETDEPDDPEVVTVEEEQAEDEDESGSVTPAPADEVETQPTAEETETSQEPEVEAQDDPSAEGEETPIEDAVELFTAVPAEEAPAETTAVPQETAVAETIAPLSQSSATETNLPQSTNSAAQAAPSQNQPPVAATPLPTVLDPGLEAADSPDRGAEIDTVPAERGRAQAANEEQRDIPPEPREVSTIEPTDADRGSNSSEPGNTPEPDNKATTDEEPKNKERDGKRVESAESPDRGPLTETGATAAALAIGGVLLMAAGVVLLVRHPSVSESPRRGRRAKRD